jgi:ubiquitin carboxyl-terminal hydrolase L5
MKRTFDYEPFLKAFVTELHNQGLLNPILNLDDNGRKRKQSPSKKQKS